MSRVYVLSMIFKIFVEVLENTLSYVLYRDVNYIGT